MAVLEWRPGQKRMCEDYGGDGDILRVISMEGKWVNGYMYRTFHKLVFKNT